MKEGSLRDFVLGAFAMLMLITFVHRTSDEFKQYHLVKSLVQECEQKLPRSENCVIVAMPKSKD